MRQVIQGYKTGELTLVDVPSPVLKPSYVLARNVASLESAGTEKALLELAKEGHWEQKSGSRGAGEWTAFLF